jgi:hypothetical protein
MRSLQIGIKFGSTQVQTKSFKFLRKFTHGQIIKFLVCYNLFSRDHDHVAEASRADHYRAPCCHRRIASLVPTSVGWDDRCISVEV